MDDWNLDRLGEESSDEDEGADVTWSFSGNTGTVFLVDAAQEMFERLPGEEDEDTPFTRAIKVSLVRSGDFWDTYCPSIYHFHCPHVNKTISPPHSFLLCFQPQGSTYSLHK